MLRDANERRIFDESALKWELNLTTTASQPRTSNNVPDVDPDNYLRIPTPETIPRFETDEEYSIRTQSWTDSNYSLWAKLVACASGEPLNLAKTPTAAEFYGRSIWLYWELRYGRVKLASLKVTFQSLLGMKQSNTTPVVKHISV